MIDDFIKIEDLIREDITNTFGIPESYFGKSPISSCTEVLIRQRDLIEKYGNGYTAKTHNSRWPW